MGMMVRPPVELIEQIAEHLDADRKYRVDSVASQAALSVLSRLSRSLSLILHPLLFHSPFLAGTKQVRAFGRTYTRLVDPWIRCGATAASWPPKVTKLREFSIVFPLSNHPQTRLPPHPPPLIELGVFDLITRLAIENCDPSTDYFTLLLHPISHLRRTLTHLRMTTSLATPWKLECALAFVFEAYAASDRQFDLFDLSEWHVLVDERYLRDLGREGEEITLWEDYQGQPFDPRWDLVADDAALDWPLFSRIWGGFTSEEGSYRVDLTFPSSHPFTTLSHLHLQITVSDIFRLILLTSSFPVLQTLELSPLSKVMIDLQDLLIMRRSITATNGHTEGVLLPPTTWLQKHSTFLGTRLDVAFIPEQPFPPLTPIELANFALLVHDYKGPQLEMLDLRQADIVIDQMEER